MLEQSANKVARLGINVAGKTGTPERILKNERINDGWYVFFAPEPDSSGHIVVCIRIENCQGSSIAVKLAGKHVVPILLQMGYIKSFGKDQLSMGSSQPFTAKRKQLNEDVQLTATGQQ